MNPEKWARIHLRLRPSRVRPGGTIPNSVGQALVLGKILPPDGVPAHCLDLDLNGQKTRRNF